MREREASEGGQQQKTFVIGRHSELSLGWQASLLADAAYLSYPPPRQAFPGKSARNYHPPLPKRESFPGQRRRFAIYCYCCCCMCMYTPLTLYIVYRQKLSYPRELLWRFFFFCGWRPKCKGEFLLENGDFFFLLFLLEYEMLLRELKIYCRALRNCISCGAMENLLVAIVALLCLLDCWRKREKKKENWVWDSWFFFLSFRL